MKISMSNLTKEDAINIFNKFTQEELDKFNVSIVDEDNKDTIFMKDNRVLKRVYNNKGESLLKSYNANPQITNGNTFNGVDEFIEKCKE